MPSFYKRDPHKPSCWIPTEEYPDKYDRYVALDPPVIVHGKMGGRYKKDIEAVAYAVSKESLLVAIDRKKYEHLDTHQVYSDFEDAQGRVWETIYEFSGCSEGFKFKRNIVKLIKVLTWLAKEVQKTRKTEAQKAKIEAERGHREGRCPVCFGDFIVDTVPSNFEGNQMVHHGFTRPGCGYLIGSCGGVGFPNLEVSPKGAINHLENNLRIYLLQNEKALENLPKLDELITAGFGGYSKPKIYKRGDAGFESVFNNKKYELEANIRMVKHDIEMFETLIKDWAPQKWPRKAPPKE